MKQAERTEAWSDFHEVPEDQYAAIVAEARAEASVLLASAGCSYLRTHFARRLFRNSRYLVFWFETESPLLPPPGRLVRLGCLRHDRTRNHSWRDLQRIKDALLGPDAIAVEVYPPSGQIVDTINMYHLWAWPDGLACPFDLNAPPEAP